MGFLFWLVAGIMAVLAVWHVFASHFKTAAVFSLIAAVFMGLQLWLAMAVPNPNNGWYFWYSVICMIAFLVTSIVLACIYVRSKKVA